MTDKNRSEITYIFVGCVAALGLYFADCDNALQLATITIL